VTEKPKFEPRLVYVRWDDASTRSVWEELEKHELESWEVETLGFLIKQNRRHIGVVSSITTSEGMRKGSDYTTIPRKMILEMKELEQKAMGKKKLPNKLDNKKRKK
jgi:hypothetical protein